MTAVSGVDTVRKWQLSGIDSMVSREDSQTPSETFQRNKNPHRTACNAP